MGKPLSTSMGSASTLRSRLLMIALGSCLALNALLTWQAIAASLSQRDLAQSVIRDYARLAGDQFFRASFQRLGYQVIYQNISSLAQTDPAQRGRWKAELASDSGSLEGLVEHVFTATDQGLELATNGPLPDELASAIQATIRQLESAPAPLRIFTHEGQQQVWIWALTESDWGLTGFVLNPQALQSWLQQMVASTPLLPRSLNPERLDAAEVYLHLTSAAGNTVYRAGPEPSRYLSVSMEQDQEYSGLFENYQLSVGLDQAAAEDLVIGGLPGSRVPILLAALVLNTVLIALGIGLLLREREVMRLRTDFISRVSHELRTPLTQIRMFAETLKRDRLASDSDRQRALSIIEKESVRLAHLVENVLQFSRAEKGNARSYPQTCELAPLAASVCELFAPLARDHGVAIEMEIDRGLRANIDSEAMHQILLNLLDNAVKYGPQGQTVTLSGKPLGSPDKPDYQVRLSVCDQGPGISAREQERVWQGFYRVPGNASAGTGIGLTIVADLISRMGGQVSLDSGEKGTCVHLDLPVDSAARPHG